MNIASSTIISELLHSPAIMDSGCTSHFISPDAPVTDKKIAIPSIPVSLPNGSVINSSHTANLQLHPALPVEASNAHIIPALSENSLISIGQLCDNGCTAFFTADKVTVNYNGDPIIEGPRNQVDKLWYIDLGQGAQDHQHTLDAIALAAPHYSCNAINPSTTMADRIAYYHACCFSPVLSTWCKAIDEGRFTSWPELTSSLVKKYPPRSIAMVKGHLDQDRANQRSTKPLPLSDNNAKPTMTSASEETDADISPIQTSPPALRTHFIYADCQPLSGQIYSDPTGRFIAPSSSGNVYLLVVYDYDSNYIFAEPMKTRTGAEHLAAYKRVHTTLTSRGLKPQLQRLDNEASTALQQFMQDEGVDYQLVPPNLHRRNAAERAIRTFKNHFIAGLCSTDPNFPLPLWDKLLPQALITLNLLRGSRINPRLSAQAQIHGNFDFNRTPLGPPGTKVLVHEKPSVRETWAPHALDGWYLGPALHQYRCFRVWITATQAERVSETLTWFPTQVSMPTASSRDTATAAALDLIKALQNPSPASALSPLSDSHHHNLTQLAEIFSAATSAPATFDAPTTVPPGFSPIVQQVAEQPRVVTPPNAVTIQQQNRNVQFAEGTIIHHAVKPRVEELQDSPHPTSPPPEPWTLVTYADKTRNPAQRRRQENKNKKQPAPPPIAEQPIAPVTTAPHEHGTRFQARKTPHPSNKANSGLLQHDFFEQANTVTDPITGDSFEYTQLIKGPNKKVWFNAAANEFGRLANGLGPNSSMPTGTNTIRFIKHDDLPAGRKATYSRFVAAEKQNKAEKFRVRLTVGGNLVDYPGKVSTPTVDMPVVKCLLNSVVSTPNARFCSFDISDFYLNTTMERKEYMRIPIAHIPQLIVELYDLLPLVRNGYVLVEIGKGMYGLPQAGILANNQLVAHLSQHGYTPAKHTPGLFRHSSNSDLAFTLCVDDFGIKYVNRESAEHLETVLKLKYKLTTDWAGTSYLGLTLQWDYVARTVDISMPGYIEKALIRFQHSPPSRPQHSPHSWIAPQYGVQTQLTDHPDNTAALPVDGKLFIQQVLGVLLYYARAVDNTLLVALNTLASTQANPTENTYAGVVQILNYCATHPDAVVRYNASGMALHIHSDASYLSASQARSRVGGYFFLSDALVDPNKAPLPDAPPPPFNGPILINSSIMKSVLASAAEAELGALFYNAKDGAMLRTILADLGHPQSATPIQTDNACAAGIVNSTVKQRRSKAIDMRFYWVRDRVEKGEFIVYWKRGAENDADYFTKHHSPSHHRKMRSRYLHEKPHANSPASRPLRGCVDIGACANAVTSAHNPLPSILRSAGRSVHTRARHIPLSPVHVPSVHDYISPTPRQDTNHIK